MKLNKILFPVDFSEASMALNGEVEWLAKRFGASVTLLNVFEIPVSWYGPGDFGGIAPDCLREFTQEAKQRIESYQLQLPEDRLQRVTVYGDPAWQIKSWAEERDFDLIVMGTHGYGAIRRMILGSVAMKVLHDVKCPVWTRSAQAMGKVNTGISDILCAIELTEEAGSLLTFARDLGAEFGAAVRLIHSVPETESRPYKYFDRDLHGFLVESAREYILHLQAELGTDFPLTITSQPIQRYIAGLRDAGCPDLILLGRGVSQHAFGTLRTHAYDIIREAHCPVLSYCPKPSLNRMQVTADVHAADPVITA